MVQLQRKDKNKMKTKADEKYILVIVMRLKVIIYPQFDFFSHNFQFLCHNHVFLS